MVNVDDRNEDSLKLRVIVLAEQLASYSLEVTANEKVFDILKPHLKNLIIQEAIDIYTYLYEANDIRVQNADDYCERLGLQRKAVRTCNKLVPHIQLAKKVYHLRVRRIIFWTDRVREVKRKIQKWISSDRKRYGHLL